MPMETQYATTGPTRAEIDVLPGPVLLEFGTSWCGYCQVLQPHLAELLRQFPDVKHVKVEDGKGRPLGRSFRVKLWPNLVFLRRPGGAATGPAGGGRRSRGVGGDHRVLTRRLLI